MSRNELGYPRRPDRRKQLVKRRTPPEKVKTLDYQEPPNVLELFRFQAKIGRSKRWTHFNDRLHIDVQETSKQRHETLSTILEILRRLDAIAVSSLDMSEINFVDPEGKEGLYKDLSDLQEQSINKYLDNLQDAESARKVGQLMEKLKKKPAMGSYSVWNSYYKFVKKAFESSLGHDVFIECTTVLEDVLAQKTKSMLELKKIQILKDVVQVLAFVASQFPFLCRVIAVVMSDNDNAKPENDTLKAHDEWLLNSTNHSISDANQKILISLADSEFVDRLINLSKRPLDEADNVWNKLENLQSWVATTYVTQTSIHLLRASLQEVIEARQHQEPRDAQNSALHKLKVHNEKMYKIEALFILTLLLCGNHKEIVQAQVWKRNLIIGLNQLFNTFIWVTDNTDEPPLAIPPTDDCSADTALKVQFLRLVHSVCDHHDNKYLLLSKPELQEIIRSCAELGTEPNPSVLHVLENKLYCGEGERGLLSNILVAMKEAKETSTLRFWIARAVESFLRGPTCLVDQTFYLNRGILDHLLHLLLEIKTTSEVSQGHFDLLAELMKFNEQAFEQFEKAIGSDARFKRFMALAENSLVDSNMFIRCATLTYHKFLRAGYDFNKSKLLHYMSSKQVRARLVASLIQLITPETLNQENVSCLNTSLVFMITARQIPNGLGYYLSDLSKRINSSGTPLLENYQELLEFWLSHYSLSVKAKDCQSLEQGTNIKFREWTSTVEILLGRLPPDEEESSLIKYLPRRERQHRDKSVSRCT
uniref:Trp4-associated protein TAP1-like protein n=1 Tax=Oikopleura dioica TaxID=34765 RepID=Q8WPK0_OIKDI|nr:Trp4-associated protein TAP1-like protein [Oikopleura dioica]